MRQRRIRHCRGRGGKAKTFQGKKKIMLMRENREMISGCLAIYRPWMAKKIKAERVGKYEIIMATIVQKENKKKKEKRKRVRILAEPSRDEFPVATPVVLGLPSEFLCAINGQCLKEPMRSKLNTSLVLRRNYRRMVWTVWTCLPCNKYASKTKRFILWWSSGETNYVIYDSTKYQK